VEKPHRVGQFQRKTLGLCHRNRLEDVCEMVLALNKLAAERKEMRLHGSGCNYYSWRLV
jgi:hypothetical protein